MLRRSALVSSSIAALLLVFLCGSIASPSFAVSKEFHQTYPLQPGGSFELQNVNGPIEVEGWDRDSVEIVAVKTAKNREADLDLVSIDVDAKPSAVAVSTRYPQNEGVEVAVEYKVRMPHSAHLEHLGTVNGTLRVSGIEGVEDLRSVNGNIEVYEAGGAVHAHTTNGNVHLELLSVRETTGAIAETTNGSVLVAVPVNTQADVETRCMNGNFYSELPVTFESTLKPREMHGKLGAGGAPIRLHTVNGGIRLVALRSTV